MRNLKPVEEPVFVPRGKIEVAPIEKKYPEPEKQAIYEKLVKMWPRLDLTNGWQTFEDYFDDGDDLARLTDDLSFWVEKTYEGDGNTYWADFMVSDPLTCKTIRLWTLETSSRWTPEILTEKLFEAESEARKIKTIANEFKDAYTKRLNELI